MGGWADGRGPSRAEDVCAMPVSPPVADWRAARRRARGRRAVLRAPLRHAQRPTPWSAAPGIEMHIAQQVLLLVSGGHVQRAIHSSIGMPGWPTPIGHFTIISRDPMSFSVPFRSWLPLAQYFHSGYALHEYPEVPGFPASHGCVRLPAQEAQVVWDFGRLRMRVSTSH